jgi:hypothetical protein
MFIGYPRSGHSLIGSLLDAHPNAIIANELDALKYIEAGFTKQQLFYLALRNSRRAAVGGRERTGYFYNVAGQWQGRFEKLLVIGDKMGGASAFRLRVHPSLLDSVRRAVNVPIKFIHVIRNPYDIISTISVRTNRSLVESRNSFFGYCDSVAYIKQRVSATDIYDLKHEEFVKAPTVHLKSLCDFIGLKTNAAYLEACASIVFASPHKSRFEAPWNRDLIDAVYQTMSKFQFLLGYSYDD